eukprot:758996-Amphidinium_carterae.1
MKFIDVLRFDCSCIARVSVTCSQGLNATRERALDCLTSIDGFGFPMLHCNLAVPGLGRVDPGSSEGLLDEDCRAFFKQTRFIANTNKNIQWYYNPNNNY